MTGIRQAMAELDDAETTAKEAVSTARLRLGQEILKARDAGVPQKDIADLLNLTREQVRRLGKAAESAPPAAES